MAKDYDRYQLIKNNDGSMDQMPFVPIRSGSGDKYVEWVEGKSRMDKLSQRYYGSPYYDWLIMYANPEFISEFDIVDGATIRIPFPLNRALSLYQDELAQIRAE